MGKRTGVEQPMYRVWRPDLGETEETGEEYAAIDVKSAARRYAEDGAAHKSWEHFPVVVHVRVLGSPGWIVPASLEGTWVVEVERHFVPEYCASTPLPAKMPKQVHALWNASPICLDIRLAGARADWPEGQGFENLKHFLDATLPKGFKRCEECARRAPRQIESLKLIGAWPT